MITNPIVLDLIRVASIEARSALPDAAYRPETTTSRRGWMLPALRRQTIATLRRLANVLQPATAGARSRC